MRKFPYIFIILFLSACTLISQLNLDELYGTSDPTRYELPVAPIQDTKLEFHQDIKPILNNRCVVCHGCYDAPCQLNLASYEGLSRGANKELVYDGTRLLASSPSRLFVDATSPSQWRDKNFFPVLNERNKLGDIDASVISRILALKNKEKEKEKLNNKPLPNELYDFNLNREQSCPSIEEMAYYEQSQPHGGMPYGLPSLSEQEQNTLNEWIAAGSPAKYTAPLAQVYSDLIVQWESFLNKDSKKAQLMSRYVYEHWFLANLYFNDIKTDSTSPQFFKIVRSSTPPGDPIKIIATRRPFDNPGVQRVYYRIKPVHDTILFKTHMPYALNQKRIEKLEKWFINDNYTVTKLPGYDPVKTANPFITFAELPTNSRYEFMLDEARFTIMGFIKGSVCRGQIALNVINDHFWVVFVKPERKNTELGEAKLKKHLVESTYDLRLPAGSGSTTVFSDWLKYSEYQMAYLEAKAKYVNSIFKDGLKPTLDFIWDGDGVNKNAALTIFRHFDTASVEYGLVGDSPQTMWLIDYQLLEKIHYLLVAGFDVYGNYGHQLKTRLYMDFLRMEGESNIINFLPKSSRQDIIDQWYQDESDTKAEYFNNSLLTLNSDSGIVYQTNDHFAELQKKISTYLSSILDNKFELNNVNLPTDSLKQLTKLSKLVGKPISFLSQVSFITVVDKNKEHHFTITNNSAYTSVSHLFLESTSRVPKRDTLTLASGFIGAYPNVYMKINAEELADFVHQISTLSSALDYGKLLDQYGIRRTHKDFWKHSDKIHAAAKEALSIEYGLLDYNRLENK